MAKKYGGAPAGALLLLQSQGRTFCHPTITYALYPPTFCRPRQNLTAASALNPDFRKEPGSGFSGGVQLRSGFNGGFRLRLQRRVPAPVRLRSGFNSGFRLNVSRFASSCRDEKRFLKHKKPPCRLRQSGLFFLIFYSSYSATRVRVKPSANRSSCEQCTHDDNSAKSVKRVIFSPPAI